jgi:outer membrane murein-binding lipoprotein Lpp
MHTWKRIGVLIAVIIVSTLIAGCHRDAKKQTHEIPDSVYLNSGGALVARTFDTLRQSLVGAIQQHGFEGAIDFCQAEAQTLTNTFADSVTVRRAALRTRNPIHTPDSLERAMITSMIQQLERKEAPSVNLVRVPQRKEIHYFKPIIIQPMCLNCHGSRDQVQPSTLARIQNKYPNDQAIDYKEGDLRGVWHVIFKGPSGVKKSY